MIRPTKLSYISDNIAATNYTTDIDDQSPNNYAYDSIGNLIQVASDGVTNMQWTVYGKLKKAIGLGFSQEYVFDANNNRVIKIGQQGSITGKQYYIRDAQGNILASYSYDGTSLKWNEQDLYGSSRIGLWSWNKAIPSRVMLPQSETDTLTTWYLLGGRYYELTNHLGNVLSVITDKKKGVSLDSATVDHYQAEVLSQQDYYPFGMLEPGRNIRTIPYPYLFNGKRMENVELSITNIYDYGMRSYDARIGRFYSVDPLTSKYPELSPYQFSGNSPIANLDLDGKEKEGYLKHLLRVYLGIGPKPKTAKEAYIQAQEKKATQNVLNDVEKLANTYNTVYGSFIPGYSALFKAGQGNYGNASINLGLDLFGGEIVGGILKFGGRAVSKIVGEEFLNESGRIINDFLKGNTERSLSYLKSFLNEKYAIQEATKEFTVYRVSGGSSTAKGGEFFSLIKPKTSKEAEELLNINKFGNTGTEVTPVTIKKGQQFAIGRVAGGKGEQIFIPREAQDKIVRHLNQTVSLKPE